MPLLVAVKHCARGKRLGLFYRLFTDHTVAVSKNAEDFLIKAGVPAARVTTIENGFMTKDLVGLFHRDGVEVTPLNSRQFLEKIAELL